MYLHYSPTNVAVVHLDKDRKKAAQIDEMVYGLA